MLGVITLLADASPDSLAPTVQALLTHGGLSGVVLYAAWKLLQYYRDDVMKLISDHRDERTEIAKANAAEVARRDELCQKNVEVAERNALAVEKIVDRLDRVEAAVEKKT